MRVVRSEEQLFQVFADVLKVEIASVTEASSPETTPNWDSLATVNLVAELEQAFGVQFDILEIVEFHSVGIVKSILMEKGVVF